MITREQIIIRMMPFSKAIKDWCILHPEFAEALKITHPERFIAFQAVSTSFSPFKPNDEVIGFYVYDSLRKIIKQDYIVNINNEGKQFILYTTFPGQTSTKYVKSMKEFENIYAKGKYYTNSHHPSLDGFSGALKDRALQAIKLGEKLSTTGLRALNEEDLLEYDKKLKILGL